MNSVYVPERELKRIVLRHHTAEGTDIEMVLTRTKFTNSDVPVTTLSVDATMKNTLIMNTEDVMNLVDGLLEIEADDGTAA